MASASLTGRCVLIIEDQPLIALNIQQALEREGGKVKTAYSVASAARLVECDDLSAAIVDLFLADGDTGGICATLKARGVPFILHSGFASGSDVLGAAAVIPKPASPDDLVVALRRALLPGIVHMPRVDSHVGTSQ